MKFRLPFITLTLALLAVLVHVWPGAAEALQLDRGGHARGEWWRFFTAHLTHFNRDHLVWDVGALLALGTIAEGESRRRFGTALLAAAFAISTAVWWCQPQFATYRGLSGLASACFGVLAGSLLQRPQRAARITAGFALLAIGLKTAFEVTTDSTLFAAASHYAPVPLAHLIGLVVGVAAVFVPTPPRLGLRTGEHLALTRGSE
jgi:rhomboid family GlyGly-CTERM serine protease